MAASTQEVQWIDGRVKSQVSITIAIATEESCSPTAETRRMRLYDMQVEQKWKSTAYVEGWRRGGAKIGGGGGIRTHGTG